MLIYCASKLPSAIPTYLHRNAFCSIKELRLVLERDIKTGYLGIILVGYYYRPLFLYFRLFYIRKSVNKCSVKRCQWLDLNSCTLVWEVIDLSTVLKRLPLSLCSNLF